MQDPVEECCAACCPAPEPSAIQPVGDAGKARTLVQVVMVGEAINVIMRMMVFDPMFGIFTLIHLWMDYIVYARMDFCFTFMIIFMSGWDLVQIFMHTQHKDFKEKHLNSSQDKVMFYIILAYSVFRVIAFIICYKVFRV